MVKLVLGVEGNPPAVGDYLLACIILSWLKRSEVSSEASCGLIKHLKEPLKTLGASLEASDVSDNTWNGPLHVLLLDDNNIVTPEWGEVLPFNLKQLKPCKNPPKRFTTFCGVSLVMAYLRIAATSRCPRGEEVGIESD